MIKSKIGKVISVVCAGALVFAMSGYSTSANAATKKVTIKVWDPGLMGHLTNGALDTKTSFIYKAKKAYEKLNPNVTIEISEIDGGVSDTQFKAASIAKNGPDIKIGFAGGNTLSFAAFLEPLDKYFTKAELALVKGTGTVREGYNPTGPLLAMPYGAGSYFYVFYDKRVMAAHTINMTNPPKTWESFLALAKKLKDAGVETPIWETNLEGYTGAWVIASLVGGQLGPNAFFDMYTGKTKIDSAAMIKAYQGYQNLYTSGVTNPDATTAGQGDRLNGFLAGPIFKGLGENAGTFAIPQLSGSKYPKILAGGTNVAVSVTKYSKNKAEAIKFVKYLMLAKTIDTYVKTTQTEPSNHVNADASVIVNPLLQAQAKDVAKNPQVYPFDNIMPGPTNDLFYKLNASVALGQTTPADAVKQLQASLNENKQ